MVKEQANWSRNFGRRDALRSRSEKAQATVYQKHMALLNRKMMYKALHLPGAGRLRGGVSFGGLELKPQ